MRSHDELAELLQDASEHVADLKRYRNAVQPILVTLDQEMAASLGVKSGQRHQIPFLEVVVSAISDKLAVNPDLLDMERSRDQRVVVTWLGDNQWVCIERKLFTAVSRDGVAFVLTSWEDEATQPTFAFVPAYDGTSGAGVINDSATFNTWAEDDFIYLDIYTLSTIEQYRRTAEGRWEPYSESEASWPIPWVDAQGQPLGTALTCFSIETSDIASAIPVGNDLNEALLDLMATSRLQGWPQRYLKGQRNANVLTNDLGQPIMSPVTGRPFPRVIKNQPGSLFLVDADGELGQLDGATPNVGVFDKLLETLTFISKVPSHYFTGEWPSGVALIQSESRLNHLVEAHQGYLTAPIIAVIRLAMRLSNLYAHTTFAPDQSIAIAWFPPQVETEDLIAEREQRLQDAVTGFYSAGLMSLRVAIQTIHSDWTDEQVDAEVGAINSERAARTPEPTATSLTSQAA